MNYRMTQEFRPPFHVNTLIEEAGRIKVLLIRTHLLNQMENYII